MAEARAPDLAQRLRAYLRVSLREPGLEFSIGPAPVTGGVDTTIVAFQLRGAAPPFSGPLILRLLAAHHDRARVIREQAAQNALVDLGYPVPRALLATMDMEPLGAPFLLMERLPGTVLPEARLFGMGGVMAPLHARLHALDPDPFRKALEGFDVGFDAHLSGLEARIAQRGHEGLAGTVSWLLGHRPSQAGAAVICHGDFHPYNVLVGDGAVTGVVDWPNAVVAEREFDVATTKIILEFAPVAATRLPRSLRWSVRLGRRLLIRGYLRGYARRFRLDADRLRYYEVAACLKALLRVAESRQRRADGGQSQDPLDVPSFTGGLIGRVGTITGTPPTLPS